VTLTSGERTQLLLFAAIVVGLHVIGWGAIGFWVAPRYPFMLGFAGLAYSFGLRHAFDADHIAAIDNTTRKLMVGQSRPFGVGFFFSLGHSSVVFAMTLAVAVAARWVAGEMPLVKTIGGFVGTTVSGLFLYAIGLANLFVLIDLFRVFRALQRGEYDPAALETSLLQRGWISRWVAPLFRVVTRPRQMYWIGLLFGLGFDTASEVALLTTAGVAASQALPVLAVLSLPVVFAAGMTLMDTADGVMMCGAYGWAFSNPLRKVFYNLTVTGLSVVVALFVGTIELAGIVSGQVLHVHSGIWDTIQRIDFQTMGYAVAALFAACWILSVTVWRLGQFERRWPDPPSSSEISS
jgi:high-affinity nickel-transport protein